MTDQTIEDTEHLPQTPDHSYVIVALAGEHPEWLTANTPESILAFMQEAGRQLIDLDAEWCFESVSPSVSQAVMLPNNQSISADTFVYGPTMQAVHVLKNALDATMAASPHWVVLPQGRPRSAYPISPAA